MTRNQAIESAKNLERQAQMVGLEFDFETIVMTNTFDAHRLTQFSRERGKMHEMTERLFRAYFTESKHIGDHQTLIQLAEEVGLNGEEVATMLKGNEYAIVVRGEEQEAAHLGVTGVPFYVIDRKYAVSGAQPSEVFLQALERAWQETQPLTVLNEQGEVCDESGCQIPDKKE